MEGVLADVGNVKIAAAVAVEVRNVEAAGMDHSGDVRAEDRCSLIDEGPVALVDQNMDRNRFIRLLRFKHVLREW